MTEPAKQSLLSDFQDQETAINDAGVEPEVSCWQSFVDWFCAWTEDGVGVAIAFVIFACGLAISATGHDLSSGYAKYSQWPVGGAILGLLIIYSAHRILKKPFSPSPYFSVILIAIIARSIGNYSDLSNAGLGASLWAIFLGILCRYFGMEFGKSIFSGEFFVKIGVTLLAMDFTSIVSIGLPGLLVAWVDTLIVLSLGTLFAVKIMSFDLKDGIVVAGATSICGSSAATAISSSIHPPDFNDKVSKAIIAIMGVFNAPLMPIMPLLKTLGHINPAVVGAWIGGSIDSTGQVVASAQMGGDVVLKTAVIVKMAQNILIGPLCLFFTGVFQDSFQPRILLSRFPLFVVGFLMTSTVVTIILNTSSPSDLQDLAISNSWTISEWITLLGFACIGLEIDIHRFFDKENGHSNVFKTYICIQTLDLLTTFGWAYLVFHNHHNNDDDTTNEDQSI